MNKLQTVAVEKYRKNKSETEDSAYLARLKSAEEDMQQGIVAFEKWFDMVPDNTYIPSGGTYASCILEKDNVRLMWCPGYREYFPDYVYVDEHFRYVPLCRICGTQVLFVHTRIRSMLDLGKVVSELEARHSSCRRYQEYAQTSLSWAQRAWRGLMGNKGE